MDVVTHDSALLREIHARAHRYDVRVEHMWTYCQVVSAMMMSIAHGSNDVANAVGPWAATYQTYSLGVVNTEAGTPVWFLVIAGLLLGLGFWYVACMASVQTPDFSTNTSIGSLATTSCVPSATKSRRCRRLAASLLNLVLLSLCCLHRALACQSPPLSA